MQSVCLATFRDFRRTLRIEWDEIASVSWPPHWKVSRIELMIFPDAYEMHFGYIRSRGGYTVTAWPVGSPTKHRGRRFATQFEMLRAQAGMQILEVWMISA